MPLVNNWAFIENVNRFEILFCWNGQIHRFNMFLFPSIVSKNYSNFVFESNLVLMECWHRFPHTYSVVLIAKNLSLKMYFTFSFSFCVLTGYIFIKFEVAYSTQSACNRLIPRVEIFWLTFFISRHSDL